MPHPPHHPLLGALHTGEFARADEAATIAIKHLGLNGRCYGSMSAYHGRTPDHLTVRNANVCTMEHGKIWWGDCDVTLVAGELRALARELGVMVYVLPEGAARFQQALVPEFEQACYVTDGSDEGFVPTRTWAAATLEERRRAVERRPGRLTLRFTQRGLRWKRVDAQGDLRPISSAEAREEFARRGLSWDPSWDEPEDGSAGPV